MHRLIAVVPALAVGLSLMACGASETGKTGVVSGEITVSAYDTMGCKAFLEDAARLFEQRYPGTTVTVETFSAMPQIRTVEQDGEIMVVAEYPDDAYSEQDYVTKISAELMSGEGADILALDVLPFHKYAEAGHFENLDEYMQSGSGFNKADYRANILEAAGYKGSTWFLPVDYSFNYYTYDSSLLAEFGAEAGYTAEGLIALAERRVSGERFFDRPGFTAGPGGSMWELLLNEGYTAFVDMENKSVSFDDGRFEELLEAVKRYAERGYIPTGADGRMDAEGILLGAAEDTGERTCFRHKNAISLIALYAHGCGIEMSALAEGDTMAIGDDDVLAGIAANTDGAVPFTCTQAYAMNANSANKPTAWAFLSLLLSEEVQLSPSLPPSSLPVSNAARAKKAQLMLEDMMVRQGQAQNAALTEALGKYNAAVERMSDQINTYVIRDAAIDELLTEQAQYFFTGERTAADVAAVLQNRLSLYLKE